MASNNPSGKSTMNQDNAAIATLGIRVTSIEGQVSELRSAMGATQSALSTEIRNVTTTLTSKIDDSGRQPWQLYVSVLIGIFSLYAYIDNSKIGPLKEKDQDLIATVKEISAVIRTDVVPFRTHAREWQQNDERFQRMEERIKFGEGSITDRVKRIEDTFNGTWSVRDGLRDMGSRIERLEQTHRVISGAEKQ